MMNGRKNILKNHFNLWLSCTQRCTKGIGHDSFSKQVSNAQRD